MNNRDKSRQHTKNYDFLISTSKVELTIANCRYSTHILFHFNIYNFSLKWHNLITYAGDACCSFTYFKDIIDYAQ